jgi:IMP cyclohydrolase
MANPDGPYPGRQLFAGLTAAALPCFTYLVTGRSPESRQRQAVQVGDTVRMGPIGDAPYDPLRHYSAVKFDNASGTLAVSNGIQTEAVFELYKLLANVGSPRTGDYVQKIMEGAQAEPDSYHTPRIAACLVPTDPSGSLECFAAIKAAGEAAAVYRLSMIPGTVEGLSVYRGDLAKPEARDPRAALTTLPCSAASPGELADFLFDLSAAEYEGNDIRVCCVAGVWSGTTWELALRNR